MPVLRPGDVALDNMRELTEEQRTKISILRRSAMKLDRLYAPFRVRGGVEAVGRGAARSRARRCGGVLRR